MVMRKVERTGSGHRMRGQAMTEYLVLTSLCLIAMMGTMAIFLDKALEFYLNVLKIVCLPFP
jgi:hypothetical protein